MEAVVKKSGKVIGYSIHGDVLYICFTVQNDSFIGLYSNLVAIKIAKDDIKRILNSLEKHEYILEVFFRGNIINNIAFRYDREAERSKA